MNKKMILWLAVLFLALQACTQKPKYVFLFIGDGMGMAQVSTAEAYLSAKENVIGNQWLSFSHFPVIGLSATFSADSFVTCSSAAATALACGYKTNNYMVNISPSGDTLRPITYKMRDAGYKIGIATTVSIDHATPAGFYAVSGKRTDYYDIAKQLPLSGFNFFAGGGFISPKGKESDRPDIHEYLSDAGYTIVRSHQDVTAGKDKIVLFQAEGKGSALPTAISREPSDLTLPQITEAAIRVLENKKGFFLMVEGGQIDWTSHANDGASAVYETIDFAAAVQVAVDFYKKYPKETLIIVTADHETGGMSLNENSEADKPFDFGWTTKKHTGVAVPIYAIGAGSKLFGGKMDNTDIPKRICQAMGINER